MSESQQPRESAGNTVQDTSPASPGSADKVRAVADALTQLGETADPAVVAEHMRTQQRLEIAVEEVCHIRAELLKRAQTPPGPDQPPPENALGRTPASSGERGPFERPG